jgi:DNA polymerase V
MKAIVDCNSFYCSCERVFKPELNTKAVVVLSNNDGCIISISDEAKKFDVSMAGPYFEAKHIIEKNNIATFSSNYNLYGDLSWRVMETLRELVGKNRVEVYSVDEAFLDLSMTPADELHEAAKNIKETVEQWTGISVSIGVAPTKTLAKLANNFAKKNKALTKCINVLATREEQVKILKSTRVSSIWGVGRAYANKLINLGITSAWELSCMPEEWSHRHLGGVVGSRLIKELRGEPAIEMERELTVKKMIATTRMFGEPVTDITAIKEAVATYTSRAAEKLRRQHCAAKVISVFVVPKEQSHSANSSHGPTVSSYSVLPYATSITNELIKPAVEIVEGLYERGRMYKKAGVMLSGLEPDESIQANLFLSPAKNSYRSLMSMVDNVNFGMRDDIIKFAVSGTTRDWKMRQELRSPRYTSRWDELREVR